MPCRSPLVAYRDHTGKTTFKQHQAGGYGPGSINVLRCGVCRDCRLYRAREWAIRCYHEAQLHPENCFVTLTFEDDPGSLSKRHLQLFLRRLRKALPSSERKFRYFACGEYGEKLGRPHYHACLFGVGFKDKYAWSRTPKGSLLYRSALLEKAWPYGHASIGELTLESAGYTARYTMKKQMGDKAKDHYVKDHWGHLIEVEPEFQLSSKQPAIGLEWIEKYWQETAKTGSVVYKGKECPIPTYYIRYIEANHHERYQEMREAWKKNREGLARESGLRLHQAALSRDVSTKNLRRSLESEPENQQQAHWQKCSELPDLASEYRFINTTTGELIK